MRSRIADAVRTEQIDELRELTAAERVALAFELGERDLRFYVAFNDVDRETAIRNLERAGAFGRRYSRCMDDLRK